MDNADLILAEVKSLKEMNAIQFKHLDDRHESLSNVMGIAMTEINRNKVSIDKIFRHNSKQDESIANVVLTHEREHSEIEKEVEHVKNKKDIALAKNLKGLAWKIISGILASGAITLGAVKLISFLSGGAE